MTPTPSADETPKCPICGADMFQGATRMVCGGLMPDRCYLLTLEAALSRVTLERDEAVGLLRSIDSDLGYFQGERDIVKMIQGQIDAFLARLDQPQEELK